MVKGTTVAVVAGVVAVVGIIGYVFYSGEQQLGKFLENFKLPELPGFPNITFPSLPNITIPSVDVSGLENWLSTQWPFNQGRTQFPTSATDIAGVKNIIEAGKSQEQHAFISAPSTLGTYPAAAEIVTYSSGMRKGQLPVGGVSAPQ